MQQGDRRRRRRAYNTAHTQVQALHPQTRHVQQRADNRCAHAAASARRRGGSTRRLRSGQCRHGGKRGNPWRDRDPGRRSRRLTRWTEGATSAVDA